MIVTDKLGTAGDKAAEQEDAGSVLGQGRGLATHRQINSTVIIEPTPELYTVMIHTPPTSR